MEMEKKKRNISPEARERLSKLAKERHARGEFGGSEFGKLGGRPRGSKKERISKRVAEAAMEESNAKAIVEVFKDAIHPNQPISVRLKGATAWAELANQHAKIEMQEDANDHQMHSREEALAILAEKLTSGPAAAILRGQIEKEAGIASGDIIEGEVVEDAAA